ncbi:PREDICTED: uncharacterized protein LOC104593970 isoform X2 [Nelumbo nucifera]|uniref:Uncharacterized protein LOC104593970 isoform X2 n=1 Tax=Nelumbo nucifera TaxID=4432 RepID=A0A1U7ZL16_NELNU|nr:PREDICTED: uncharacterized protein LOC104593970 isoform X2 [Nelumbo nucifera]
MHLTTIRAMEKDLDLVKSDTKRLKEETERMMKAKDQTCSKIFDKQKKIASLHNDSSTLSQTLELIIQERVNTSAKLQKKKTYYAKIMEDMNAKLQEQQDWINSHKLNTNAGKLGLVETKTGAHEEGDIRVKTSIAMDPKTHRMGQETNEKYNDIMTKLDGSKAKLEEIMTNKSKLVLENCKPALITMDMKALEEEHKALLSDNAAEVEYFQCLQHRIEQIKGISHVIKCPCGVEYKVELENSG